MLENGLFSSRNLTRVAKALYDRAGTAICRMLRCMFCSSIDMYNMMCVVADYVDIDVHTYVEFVNMFTMTPMFCDVKKEKIETMVCNAFSRGSV